jgi:very-short-patch-repair endonuclease
MSMHEKIFSQMLSNKSIIFKTQYKFSPTRRWRSDFYIPAKKVLIEIEGGIWTNGRHTRGRGFINDCEKYNYATLSGYNVIRIPTPWFCKNMKMIEDIIKYLLS